MKLFFKIVVFLFFVISSSVFSQTPGLNYQALILNSEEVQIPGTNVESNKIPMADELVILRFSIINQNGIEYIEEHEVITDENGMVSLIVGEGTPVSSTFNQIIWDGNPKDLNVDINILSQNSGFTFLDLQKILYIPFAGNQNVSMVANINDLLPADHIGTIAWVENYDGNQNPTLVIWDGSNWLPVNNDFDPLNEFHLLTVTNATNRDAQFQNPDIGTQVWNQDCNCIEVYNGNNWVSIEPLNNLVGLNGITVANGEIKLGGTLTEQTTLNTSTINTLAINGLEASTALNNEVIVLENGTNVLKKKNLSSLVEQTQVVVTATNGQSQFTTPSPIFNINKLDVYRNGVRIRFTLVDSNTIQLEPEATCYAGDEIRIVQLN